MIKNKVIRQSVAFVLISLMLLNISAFRFQFHEHQQTSTNFEFLEPSISNSNEIISVWDSIKKSMCSCGNYQVCSKLELTATNNLNLIGTELQLFLNRIPKNDSDIINVDIDDVINISVFFRDLETGIHIPNATVQLYGWANLSETNNQYYNFTINANDLGLGIIPFIIFAEKENYQPQNISFSVEVNRIIGTISREDGGDQIEVYEGEDVLLNIILLDPQNNTIKNATVTYLWVYGQGLLEDLDNNGIYNVTLLNVQEGVYSIRIYAFAGDNYTFETYTITLIVIIPPPFTLSSNAGTPDTDGSFTLMWISSDGANNYSMYRHFSYITEINESLTPLAEMITDLNLTLSGYSNGTYYFIVEAHNIYGNTLSNCIKVIVQIPTPPRPFTLYSDTGTIDDDGNFNLNWDSSVYADNYSVYQYSDFITEINGSLTPLVLETGDLSFPISILTNDDYYFIVEAHNIYGNTLSNCLKESVHIPPGPLNFWSNADSPDKNGTFSLFWNSSSNAISYSVYQYDNFITQINGSLIPLLEDTQDHVLPLAGYLDGDYYFIAVAHNDYGDALSRCIKVVVSTPKDVQPIPGYNMTFLLGIITIVGIYLTRKKLLAKSREK
ncbi:MAG: hypothetical protein ACFFC1_18810 [Promethearchaeota archaeon]